MVREIAGLTQVDMHDKDRLLAELITAHGGDAVFRPSSAKRWMTCVGSTMLSARAPRERTSSVYAREGTAAHALAELCLKEGIAPEEMVDRTVFVREDKSDAWRVDEEMASAVQVYLNEIAERWEPGCDQFVEYKMSLEHLDPSYPLLAQNRGTGDGVILNYKRRRVTIADLKYGRGVAVSANAPQLKNYGVLTLVSFPIAGGWKEVETLVVQPRLADERDRVKSVVHDAADLMTTFLGELVGAMDAALDPDAALTPGDHCRWCPAKTICPAVRDRALNLARDAFESAPPMTSGSLLGPLPTEVFVGTVEEPRPAVPSRDVVVLPPGPALSNDDIATILNRAPIFDLWLTGIKQEAVRRLETGSPIPGYKLVAPSGNRRWAGEDRNATIDALRQLGLNVGDVMTDPALKSPAQVEKLLPKDKRPALTGLVERPLGAPTLVSSADVRSEADTAQLGPIG